MEAIAFDHRASSGERSILGPMAHITWKPVDDPTAERSELPDSAFAFPAKRSEPLVDAAHVRSALARFDQVEGVDDNDRALAFANIKAAAAHFGVHLSETDWHDLMH
jgi:hypothetical protein